ncbi:hypothetical protein ACFST9_14845 [Hymenobacter monticola]|uniref:DUF1778 domain-containing protein n=1 Tax=Hymenobacter monticola TaxID=1705399 RepID=A0ABY4B374_9BACT|nr:hypothetical protein [Hymenobacter monticola]UOE32807.1 hypothetical protein MTP16_16930 [Hymenobacter monticola]
MTLEIKVTPEQHQQLQQLAAIHSLTLHEYMQAVAAREIRILQHFLEAPASEQPQAA